MEPHASDAPFQLGTICALAVPAVLTLVAFLVIVVAWSRQDTARRSFVELLVLVVAQLLGAATLFLLVPGALLGALGSELVAGESRMFQAPGAFGAWMDGAAVWLFALALSGLVVGPTMMLAAIGLAMRRRLASYAGAVAALACGLHHLLVAAAVATAGITAYGADDDVALRITVLLLAAIVVAIGIAQSASLAWAARRAHLERAAAPA